MNDHRLDLLYKELKLTVESATTLEHSLAICKAIERKLIYSIEELDHFEALTSRFARLSDIIIQKVIRLIGYCFNFVQVFAERK